MNIGAMCRYITLYCNYYKYSRQMASVSRLLNRSYIYERQHLSFYDGFLMQMTYFKLWLRCEIGYNLIKYNALNLHDCCFKHFNFIRQMAVAP